MFARPTAKAALFSATAPIRQPLIECLEQRLCLSAGQPDSTFGTGGTAFGELFPGGAAYATALQSNGQIIAAGTTGSSGKFALARFNADGSLDRTFGSGGRVTTTIGGSSESIQAAAVQSNGDIVVAGYNENQTPSTNTSSIIVARYLPSGALDTTFGTKGLATISFLGDDTPSSLLIQSNGDIVVGGSAQKTPANTPREFALARLTSAGKLDSTFGTGGKVLNAFPGSGGGIDSLVLQTNGDIIASGSTDKGDGSYYYLTLVRYKSNGTLDSTFGSHGIVTSSAVPGIGNSSAEPIPSNGPVVATLESNGTIVVATEGSQIETDPYSATNTLYVAEFNSAGVLNTSFGKKGLASYTDNAFITPSAVFTQKNGDIVVAGTSTQQTPVNAIAQFLYVRFSSAGVLGTTNHTPMAGSNGSGVDNAYAALQEPNQDIVMVGYSNIGSNGGDFALARYTLAGALDATFGYHGTVQQVNGITGLANAIAEQSNGKILVVGSEQSPDPSTQPTDAAIVRYNANGTLDTTFGVAGRVFYRIGNIAAWNAVKILSNGDILVAGAGQVGTKTEFALAELLPGGTFNTAFGSGGVVLTPFTGGNAGATSLAIQSNGDIVAGGFATLFNTSEMAAARYLPNGKLDTTFDQTGTFAVYFHAGAASVAGVVILKNNDILLAGTVNGEVELDALTSSGALDIPYTDAETGYGLTPFSDGPIQVNAVGVDPTTGDIVIGGTVTITGRNQTEFGLARYTPKGVLDSTFGHSGEMTLNVEGNETLKSLAVQSNGRIVVGGTTLGSIYNPGSIHPDLLGPPIVYATVVRFTSTGLDSTFGEDGFVYLDQGSTWNPTDAVVALQTDGKILAGDVDLYRIDD